ncbi:MAG: rhamnulokinase [Defluviitaleaceae bacterium]|nr:rhamnulokinase [Defluviitaleaceae bacterium]
MEYFLAIDIGASSGRHMLGHIEDGRLVLTEIHRFPNDMVKAKLPSAGSLPEQTRLTWDINALFKEILAGLKKCAEIGKHPVSVGIDTWGVDFVLLDEDMEMIGPAVAYRDKRTEGMYEETARHITDNDLYARTGIQKMIFNTIYQLMALKKQSPEALARAHKLLFIPDYLHYLLTGVAQTEYTVASTSALVNAKNRDWDEEIIAACGFPRRIFGEIAPPGTVLGELTPDIQHMVGFNCKVILPASHDTASAVMAVPARAAEPLYISSGTWSLMGVERSAPDTSPQSQDANFTNEGGYGYSYRYLKNIMGLWMIQCVKKELDNKYTYAQLCDMAEESQINSIVDVNAPCFLSPENMTKAIQAACAETNQPIPNTPGELAAVIYNSLAASYRDTARELETLTGKAYDAIYIVGGGSNAEYLNNLTAKYTGKAVHAGPSEATAIGNIAAQMIANGCFADLQEARACIRNSI